MQTRSQKGFTYLAALFLVAGMSIIALRAMEVTSTRERRAREAELLWVGQVYLDAIKAYYTNTPGFVKRYPPNLQALLLDQRTTRVSRPLRKLYADPISGVNNLGIIEAPDGGVMGVYSLSERKPLKAGGFTQEFAAFADATTYQQWKFVYQPS
jgi:type II secretory pathway pseudopilin PulG